MFADICLVVGNIEKPQYGSIQLYDLLDVLNAFHCDRWTVRSGDVWLETEVCLIRWSRAWHVRGPL